MKKFFTLLITLFCISFVSISQTNYEKSDSFLLNMSLEELMNIEITTASNVKEQLNTAPATIIVITAKEIEERGYTQMYDILNDLPGFDLSRAFGDDNYYLYSRGYRKETSDQMLLMVDGIIMNHLYNNNMDMFGQYPVNNIKQVEIVYGPASAIYGPNAFAGIINIITKTDESSSILLTTGQNNTSIVDLNVVRSINDIKVNLSGRLYNTDGPDLKNRTNAQSEKILNDPNIWGPFMNTKLIGYKSPMYGNFLDLNATYNGLTLGVINWYWETGYGAEWAPDKVLPYKSWQFDEQTYYAMINKQFNMLKSKTLFRYRNSGNPNGSLFIARNYSKIDSTYLDDASYWQTTNRSISFFQDFSNAFSEKLTLNFGLKYERRNLQGAYLENVGDALPDDSLVTYIFPDQPLHGTMDEHNHFITQDKGIYTQVKYSPIANFLDIYAGIRYDYNSIYKDVVSPRVGIVIEPVKNLVGKVFYGTAFLEPSARVLYGGWAGSSSNTNLKPEKLNTFEASLSYTKGILSNGIDFYYNIGKDAIVGAKNIGKRTMIGGEYYTKLLIQNNGSYLSKIGVDGYISYIQSKEDVKNQNSLVTTGNMAPIKVHLILTGYFKENLSLSLQNRYIDEIKTVSTNPFNKIDSYFCTDANITYRNLILKGLSVGLKAYNIFDVKYFHPGYRDAKAGENLFDSAGNHVESLGWYNSRLPQPGREIYLTLKFEF